jgi:hypothetical protein
MPQMYNYFFIYKFYFLFFTVFLRGEAPRPQRGREAAIVHYSLFIALPCSPFGG